MLQVIPVTPREGYSCSECEETARYNILTDKRFLALCPKCFGALLRKAVAVASEML